MLKMKGLFSSQWLYLTATIIFMVWISGLIMCLKTSSCKLILLHIVFDYIIILIFLLTKPWIPGGRKSIFMVVIHKWKLPLHQSNLCMQEQSTYMTSQCRYFAFARRQRLNCCDITMPSQKRPSLAKMVKWAIYDCFRGFVCTIGA